MESGRREDYFVLAKLTVRNDEISHVPCKIFLPQDVKEHIHISLRPTQAQYNVLSHFSQASLYAELPQSVDYSRIGTVIACNVMYAKHAQSVQWGPELFEFFIEFEPQDIRVTSFLERASETKPTHVTFWISPNKMLSPLLIEQSSYLGSITMERRNQIEATLSSGMSLKFDRHFRSRREGERFIQWSMLVAEADIEIPGADIESLRHQYLESLDDFVLLASLGSRTRTACIGWTASDHMSYTHPC